ncbi:MAG: cysteine desulfurase [Proteobacteria bacterium]|nr:cysteine desulfurase [Pseudomonadota bacterium]
MRRIYLDYNATAPLRDEAKQAMLTLLGPAANPSSVHYFGQTARHAIEDARTTIADWLGVLDDGDDGGDGEGDIIFTSGATEANSQALTAFPDRTLITSPTEHSAVLAHAKTSAKTANSAIMLAVDKAGRIDLDDLEKHLKQHQGRGLLSLMVANNETGVVQPLAEATKLAHSYGAIVHSDGVQMCDKAKGLMATSQVDLLSISAHKLGGPTGIGALVVGKNSPRLPPLLLGGGQEKGQRAGTENVIGIVGFAGAVKAVMAEYDRKNKASPTSPASDEADWWGRLRQWHEEFEARILAEAKDAVVFGKSAPRLPNTTAIAMPSMPAETQVMAFDLAGVAVSAGAACSSGKVATSHVLVAMGAGALADKTIRISSGWATEKSDFDKVAETWLGLYKKSNSGRG